MTRMSDDAARTDRIVEVLTEAFADLAEADPVALSHKLQVMSNDPFSFLRGTAGLFYADVVELEDRWADERTGRVWIQGDLHAENFGTYMDGSGVLVFDVNDYDEAYLGHFTWDLQRMVTSLAVLGWTKALPDEGIGHLVETYVRAYLDQVQAFVETDRDHEWSLRLDTARGAVRDALVRAQLRTRVSLLDDLTVVEEHQRRFRDGHAVRRLDGAERDAVVAMYDRYLETIPESKRLGSLTYTLKDVVGVTGTGVGSAGLPTYRVLVEGHTQALENDVVLVLKEATPAAPARVAPDPQAQEFFEHEGHRTAVSQRTLQAHADPWLGWAVMHGGPHDGLGFVVRELSPYEADLDWHGLTHVDEMADVLDQLGRATAKVHSVSDADAATDGGASPLLDFQTEDAVADVVRGREDELVADLVAFALEHGARARADHTLFVDAFRTGRLPVAPGGE